MKKIIRKLRFVLLFVIISSLGFGLSILAKDESGKIILTKEATKIDDNFSNTNEEYGRLAKVSLSVTGNPYTKEETTFDKVDIILVLDSSGSMAYDADGNKANVSNEDKRLTALKNTAKSFINTMITSDGSIRIGLIEYATEVKQTVNLTTSKDDLLTSIDNMRANGGTNIHSGIEKASELLSERAKDAKTIIIILTDGIPTYYNYTYNTSRRTITTVCGDGSKDKAGDGPYNNRKCSDTLKPSTATKEALDKLKQAYPQTDVYTITFGQEKEAASKLEEINPKTASNTTPIYKNVTALDANELKKEFENIEKITKNIIATNGVVVDTIPKEFKLTDDAKKDLNSKGISYIENSDGTTTITWIVGDIEAIPGKEKELSYYVEAKDEYHGVLYTNQTIDYKSATLTATIPKENPYEEYQGLEDEQVTLYFASPTAKIPAITKDDHYNDNESYIGYTSSIITATSILNNDLDKNLSNDKDKKTTTLSVTDEIVIEENANTIKIKDNTYELKDDNKLLGTLTINNDGTFTFTSESDVEGDISFNYLIKTKVVENNEESYVYSNTSKVTLKVIPREKTTISGLKIWDDNNNQDGLRKDSIIVDLLANGQKIKETTTTALNNWEYSFTDLYKYEIGHEQDSNYLINYTVSEKTVIEGYTTTITGTNITNTHIPQLYGDYTITKVWNDNNNQDGIRPASINVALLADGEVIKTLTLTATNNWTITLTDLPKYRDGGIEIVYSVTEEEIPGYESSINNSTITNTHIPSTIEITGTKTWNDNNNQDGIRPNNITINLLANGQKIASKTVSEIDNWTYKFSNLEEYQDGQKIIYSISEEKVTGYETIISNYNITNTHIPEKVSVSGIKTWDDNNNQDGMRPSSIIIKLLANNKEITSKVVTEATSWQYSFDDLPKYENGSEITYSISEEKVAGYEGIITDYNITNKHIPITISITGEKVWVDENNSDGLRPTSITINLLANKEIVATKTISATDNWQYTFNDLPKYANGSQIIYDVEELPVDHYETSYDSDNKYLIINTHNPKNITISGTKTWRDTTNKYGRPEFITVKLIGKVGEEIVVEQEQQVTNQTSWQYTFTNLPEYKDGKLIVYTIDEVDIKDYDKTIKGYDIINTYNPETIDISGSKTWNDNDNQDGIRPDSITINLLANGEIVETKEITKESNWTFEFKNQVVYANGEKITYTIEEVSVEGYKSEITGFDITNHHTPATVNYKITKVWNDQDNNDSIRPESITIHLFQDDKEIASKIITASNNWTYTFENLPKYRDGGIEIKYEIIEDEVKGYTPVIKKSISNTDKNTTDITIINSHENDKIQITIDKIWDDLDNSKGKRPNSITVILTGIVDNTIISTKEIIITKDMNWRYNISCDKYLNGKKISYNILEKDVDGYIAYYNGYTITNILKIDGEIIPPKTGISGNIKTNNNSSNFLAIINIIKLLTISFYFIKNEN